ncbi:BrnT family toxin [Candidatus Binatus sp.]|uniref:BrnT family toxin n=1 Tax=Candidatus Binatus sp. TaxID=2811406 RepID=UPI0032C241E1
MGQSQPLEVSGARRFSPEVEHVLAHAATLIVLDLKNSRTEPRFLAMGRTEEGRYTFVVFTPRQTRGGVFLRPISARYMHRKEI